MADDFPDSGSRDRSYPNRDDDNNGRRSPPRGPRAQSNDATQQRYQDHKDGYRANFPPGRRDYSRSPARNELSYDDAPPGDGRQAHDPRDYYYQESSGWDDEGTHRGDYRDRRDRDGCDWSRSQADDGQHDDYRASGRPASPSRKLQRLPTDTIILEGLAPDLTANDVREFLDKSCDMSRYLAIDVRLPPGRARRAFVQFGHIDDAVDFMQAHHSSLSFDFDEDPNDRWPVYMHYARSSRDELDSRGGAGKEDWICLTCDFSNYASRMRCKRCGASPADDGPHDNITGESDAGTTPSQILVFFPLAPSVTEDVLAVGASKLELAEKRPAPKPSGEGPPKLKSTAPTGDGAGFGAKPGSLHRVFLMRHRNTDESLKFGFAEFWTVEDALAALDKFKRLREFTIASAAVTVSTIHLGVFVPETREILPPIEKLSFFPLFNPTIRVKYWESSVYPSQKLVTEAAPEQPKAKVDEESADGVKKSKKRKAEGALPGTSKKAAPMMGQMAFWQKKHDEIHEGKKQAELNAQEREQEMMARSGERAPVKISLAGGVLAPPGAENRGAIKISLSSGAAVASVSASTAPTLAAPWKDTDDASTPKAEVAKSVASYVDHEKVCCLLCMMKYKSLDDLNTHERSRNHKTAMADESKVKAAQPRIAARDKRMAKALEETVGQGGALAPQDDGSAPQYRDRAKERRQVFSQPNKPGAPPPGAKSVPRRDDSKAHSSKTGSREASPPAAALQSKGSAMLAKMGWSSGQGLGAKGEGRTEVIETHAYQEGVGLGAEGGNLGDAAELARRKTTNSYADYVDTVQDKARQRYSKLE
ncbi:putative RNA-binding protein C57A7.13 like [Verticillium longisporum]|uniref:Putative RNA-binding protein C57A7.13 like n=1 Tax=Verticillium longisporum TaxID=100787 RepID=A0A8I3AL84_VERLO|nr:putative RNA-binding protein C57A7.13 like [Verticillium longisporum]